MDGTEKRRGTKPRPAPPLPKQYRERIVYSLPSYSGRHSVGIMEIELPVGEPQTFSHIKRDNVHALRMDTVLFSIYYPCDRSSYASHGVRPSRATWLPRPRVPTCKGYAKFLSIPYLPVTVYIAATTMFTKLPAFRNARLADNPPGEEQPEQQQSRGRPADSQETLRDEMGDRSPFPVIIFSHGLGGSRTCYSSVCGELASNGFIVVAVEHRDGSGARSHVNVPPSVTREDGTISDTKAPRRSYVVDYIFPKDNAQDTSPNNQRGVDTELRNAQISMRMAEIEQVYRALEVINSGQGELVLQNNLRKKGNVGSSSKGLDDINWSEWAGRMHLNKVTVMGHSFGGATTVQTIREEDRFPWVGQGITLDPWAPAIPKLDESSRKQVNKPLLTIGSEAFMHWPENFDTMAKICKDTKDSGVACWMMTVKGSTHLSQTDFAVLYPKWMSWFAKNMIHPRRAILLTVNASLEFLKKVLPDEHSFGNTWADEGILDTEPLPPTDALPSKNRPEEKWKGARLRIPNEFRLRLMSLLRRSPKVADVPTDASGKPLVGIVTRPVGKEVWMHLCPQKSGMEGPIQPSEWLASTRKRGSVVSSHCVVA
jgi:platelet-activating factor acetylhydrolase